MTRAHRVAAASAPVAVIPTATAAQAMFERYASLVRQADADPTLRTDAAHSIAIARAWADWRDTFLRWERAS